MDISGLLIRRERLRRDWSQEGVCRGICAVSYLSKVEQGKAQASEEVLRALFDRLELPWELDEADAAALAGEVALPSAFQAFRGFLPKA